MTKQIKSCLGVGCRNINQYLHFVVTLTFFIFFFITGFWYRDTFHIILQTFADAYLGVSIFVGLTLFLFYGAEYFFNFDTHQFFQKNKKYQVPISAFLGVLPGCGGAIMVITQFVAGRLGFGSVVAVLTSTMGDAAFLLLSQRPQDAALIFGIGFISGIVFGYLTEWIHGYDFLRVDQGSKETSCDGVFRFSRGEQFWLFLFIPGLIFEFFDAFQIDIDGMLGFPLVFSVSLVGGITSLLLWGTSSYLTPKFVTHRTSHRQFFGQVIFDTNFVFVWVFFAFLSFNLPVHWTGYEFTGVLSGFVLFMPLAGTLIGFLPGCGPQIIFTTLYLQGIVPFSAQISNSLSNDGDALFPAIALAPRVAFFATLYTAVPALIVGYGWYFLFEV